LAKRLVWGQTSRVNPANLGEGNCDNDMKAKLNRRTFLKTSGAFVAPTIIPASVFGGGGKPPASERVALGLIGSGGKGRDLMTDFKRTCNEVQFVAVADPDDQQADKGKSLAEKLFENGCKTYKDFREMIARKDIDAVVVATPDHWHAITCLEALRNGKDVYGEKPITHRFGEGQVLYREVAKQKRIFQVGSQQRSKPNFRKAAELVLNGHIGKVKEVEVGLPTGESSDEVNAGQPIPEHLDYDLWCGPRRKLPFHSGRLHFYWRWALEYGGGTLMDWIGHHNDIAHWALGLDKSGPIKVEAQNFRYPEKGLFNSPIDYTVRSEYEDGLTIVISNKGGRGIRFFGEDGWVYTDRRALQASNPEWTKEEFNPGKIKAYKSDDHRRNFVDGILTRKECICPAETGHRSITPGHLAYVSDALKKPIKWNAKTETIVGDPAADKLLKKLDYQGDWSLGV
jgi:predicted dehydrogenase